MDAHELAMTALRAVAVYALMLLVIRLLGKRTVGNFSAFDLLVALMLGEVVDELIYGDVNFAQGALAIVVIAGCQYANSWLTYASPALEGILAGKPTVLVRDGKLDREGMRSERMSEDDVKAELRLNEVGEDEIEEVQLATLEIDGEMSVLKHDWAQPVRRVDVEEALATRSGREPSSRAPKERG